MRKRTKAILYTSAVLIFILAVSQIPLSNGYNLLGYFYDYYLFDPLIPQIHKANSTGKSILIEISEEEFSRLIEAHHTIDPNKNNTKGYDEYNRRNKYVTCTVQLGDSVFEAKLKSHSKNPHNHLHKNRISLKIKLLNGKILGSNKFRLIVYERLDERPSKLKLLAKYFDLRFLETPLKNVVINNDSEIPYYYEVKPQKALKEKLFLNYHAPRKFTKVKSLIKAEKQDTFLFDKFYENKKYGWIYKNFNKALEEGNLDTITKYTDDDYLINFHAAALIAGFRGHGLNRDNLILPLDTNKLKFYPFLHRDFFPTCLSNDLYSKSLAYYRYGEGYEWHPLTLFSIIKQNPKHMQETEKRIRTFLEQDKKKFIVEYDSIIDYYESVLTYNSEWNQRLENLGLKNPYKGRKVVELKTPIKANIRFLEKRLK